MKRIFCPISGTRFYFLPTRLGTHAMRCQRSSVITWYLPHPIRTATIVKDYP